MSKLVVILLLCSANSIELFAAEPSNNPGIKCSLDVEDSQIPTGSEIVCDVRMETANASQRVLNPFLEPQHVSTIQIVALDDKGQIVGRITPWRDGYDLQSRQVPVLAERRAAMPIVFGRRIVLPLAVERNDTAASGRTTELPPGRYDLQVIVSKRIFRITPAQWSPRDREDELCRSNLATIQVTKANTITNLKSDDSSRTSEGASNRIDKVNSKLVECELVGRPAFSTDSRIGSIQFEIRNASSRFLELVDPFGDKLGQGGPLSPFRLVWTADDGREEVSGGVTTFASGHADLHRYDSVHVPPGGICGGRLVLFRPKANESSGLCLQVRKSILAEVGFQDFEKPLQFVNVDEPVCVSRRIEVTTQ